jgi:3',5'-cyclic AMP phosphodiesterase CpdA
VRTIAHLSDLHFGREDPRVVEAVLEDLAAGRPDLVVVSGDLTQRARRRQFQAARAFLDRFPAPVLVVPGNHDIPLFDLARRFFRPLARYRSLVTSDLAPLFQDDEVAVLGVNTARSNVWKSGRLSHDQIDGIRARLSPLPPRIFKVLVTHHPFVPPPGTRAGRLVGRGLQALQVAEACGVDLLLAGHLHVGWSGDVRAHHLSIRRSILVVQAGTATSLRVRGEPNTYNLIAVDGPALGLSVRGWDGARFAPLSTVRYVKREDEWTREA